VYGKLVAMDEGLKISEFSIEMNFYIFHSTIMTLALTAVSSTTAVVSIPKPEPLQHWLNDIIIFWTRLIKKIYFTIKKRPNMSLCCFLMII